MIMDFFTKIIGEKIKIVMTTHSNYMFNKLSNILLEDNINHERVGSYLMRMTPLGSVMDEEAMKAEEEGMEDNNFSDTAEKLYSERLRIYDKLDALKG
ncbi:hypothetical protein N008_10690 [Hymenobacter sp. APR13]|nr:hypothetical protein N008_10690 [Hymenobacter sp. APR13]